MNKYLVTLKPLSSYFFGGEVTFGEQGQSQNFFVTSNALPQPSALVGLMRYVVLQQHHLLTYDHTNKDVMAEVERLIGAKGFSLENPASGYGIIQSLSPLFLSKKGKKNGQSEYYTRMPLDAAIEVKMPQPAATEMRCSYGGQQVKQLPQAPQFNGKTYGNYKYWCNHEGIKLELNPFSIIQQIGIEKSTTGEAENKAFFKQTLMQLHRQFRMAFTVETTQELQTGGSIIPLGGNRSMFQLDIQPTDLDWYTYFEKLKKSGRLLALGDAYLTSEERGSCDFIWGQRIDLRHMNNLTRAAHSWDKPKKSILYHLLSRNSVIYANDNQLSTIRQAHAELQVTGLNWFI